MTQPPKAKYSLKHPRGARPNTKIAQKIPAYLVSGKLSCAAACQLAEDLDVSLEEIGITADIMEIPVYMCRLGLFGQEEIAGVKKVIKATDSVPDEMKQAIFEKSVDQQLDCLAIWHLSEDLGSELSCLVSYCEKLGIKIIHCQLGAFK